MATEAVSLDRGPLRCGTRRGRGLLCGLGKDVGASRNKTDSTRNADKPFSEFHTSHRSFPARIHSGFWHRNIGSSGHSGAGSAGGRARDFGWLRRGASCGVGSVKQLSAPVSAVLPSAPPSAARVLVPYFFDS